MASLLKSASDYPLMYTKIPGKIHHENTYFRKALVEIFRKNTRKLPRQADREAWAANFLLVAMRIFTPDNSRVEIILQKCS
jgi:hypothetical protein